MEAQTMHLVLFGPVIIVVAFYKHLRVFKYIISTYTYQLIQKKHVEKKNYSLGPRRHEMRRLGTFLMFVSAPTLVVVVVVIVVEL